MNFSMQEQRSSNPVGLAIVVLLHLILGYALLNGLGGQMIQVLKKPLSVAIIEEVQAPPPPPPPPKVLVPAARGVVPLPSFVPPPEVTVAAPATQNVITTSSQPDPAPGPVAAPVVLAPPAPLTPPAVSVKLACPNHVDVRSHLPYPPQAQQMGLSGDVVIEFTVSAASQIKDVTVVKSSSPLFNSVAINAVNQLRCNGQGQDVRVRVPFAFRVEN
jgi:protein TonB